MRVPFQWSFSILALVFLLLGCTSDELAAEKHFANAFSCRGKQITVSELEAPSFEERFRAVQATPEGQALAALVTASEPWLEKRKENNAWASRYTAYSVSGCGESTVYACACPGLFESAPGGPSRQAHCSCVESKAWLKAR